MNVNVEPEEPIKTEVCLNCANPAILKGFPNPLCVDCRENLIKYPLPIWVKFFAGALLLVVLFSFYKIPKNIAIGMHLDKGETAIEQKKYITAEKEYQQVLSKVPGDLEMQCNLLIASFNNGNYLMYDSLIRIIGKKSFEDQDLFNKVNSFIQKANTTFPLETFNELSAKYKNDFDLIPDTALENYIKAYPNDLSIIIAYSGRFDERKDYIKADSLLTSVLNEDKENVAALINLAGLKRMENDFKSSIYYCDKLLELNKESLYGLSSKSRTCLRQKNDKDALLLAEKSYSLDKNNNYVLASLALVYHYVNKPKERDVLLNKLAIQKDNASVTTLQYVKDVMSGKENFRN